MSRKLLGGLIGLEVLVFSLLEGSMVALGLLVPPPLFSKVGSKDLAGRIFGSILGNWLWLGLPCAIILAVTGIVTLARLKPFSRLLLARAAAPVVMAAVISVFAWVLGRTQTIQDSLTRPIDDYPTDVNPRLEFDTLHKLSTNLISVALFVGLAWLVISVIALLKFGLTDRAAVVTTEAGIHQEEPISVSV